MSKFSRETSNCIVVMYPSGGYGNFLYYLISEHLESTVKSNNVDWKFDSTGNSHQYPKHTESFLLGEAYYKGSLGTFDYQYRITDQSIIPQISQGKHLVVLGDVGNKGDNVRFLKSYFPQSKIVRIFAETFLQKLIVWTNCMTKTGPDLVSKVYPGSILTAQGIAAWANKDVDDITDSDAVDCMTYFFQTDFGPYGKMFSKPSPGVINLSVDNFFDSERIFQAVKYLAEELETTVIDQSKLRAIADEFIRRQRSLLLLSPGDTFPLIRQALHNYGFKY